MDLTLVPIEDMLQELYNRAQQRDDMALVWAISHRGEGAENSIGETYCNSGHAGNIYACYGMAIGLVDSLRPKLNPF
jgi:hypothetical protein